MIGLIDSTLREGSQTAGVYFTREQQVETVRHLAAVGIEEIELGVAARDADLPALMAAARRLAPGIRLSVWCRAIERDIAASAALVPDVLAISLPASDGHLRTRLRKDRAWALEQVARAAEWGRRGGIGYLALGLEDATRADPEFLRTLFESANGAGFDRVRVADTVGVATPARMAELVRDCRAHFGGAVGVHTHNDFGMATANAVGALEAGADWADVTVLGLGERAGNARLEEVAGFLVLARDEERYCAAAIAPLCRLVGAAAGRRIAPHHPVVGSGIFTCETGLHCAGLIEDPGTYEAYEPARVGVQRRLFLGSKSGRRAVRAKLGELGILVDGEVLEAMTNAVRERGRTLRRPLGDGEVTDLAAAFLEENFG